MKTVTSKIITNYWYGKIKGVVPFDLTVPASFRDEEIVVPAGELAYFEKVTSGEELPKFTVLLTVFSILLRRYFEEANLLCCTTRLIGEDRPTLTTIPSIDGKTLKTCLQELKQEVQDIHKYTNKEGWDDALPPLSSYAPFCFQYGSTFSLPDAPFSIAITSQDGALKIKAQFDQNFTDSVTINHLLGNFRNWLRDMDRLLDTELVSVPLISEEEKEQLLITFNPTELQVSDSSLVDLFKEQVQQNPEKVAVLYNEIALTYAELDRLSSQLAQYLVSRYEIQAGDLIGVKLERNQWLVVGILATLKAGAAYVPIDVAYPQERIDYIEKDSGCKFVVNDEIIIDCQKQLAGEITDIGETITSSQIAYIIYTSGSTGAPKGVSITQRNAVHLIEWAKTEFDLNSFETIYAATSHCFDLSIFEMFFTLSTGKTIRLFKNALDIPQYIQRDESILLNTVPSSMRTLLEENMDLGHVTAINLAGEPLPLDLAKLLLQWPLELRNLYGPSEDTTYSTCYRVTHTNFTSVPIGSPIAGTRGYVLDRWGQLCPVGVAGTLFLAGDGVAKGYLHRPELTAQMFVEDPFYDGSVMYNTGDLVKWSVDGTLQFLGRKDNQVKLRGYRIELEEVENAIRAYSEEISQAVVVVREHQATQVLVAYVVAEEPLDVNQMRAFLHGQLPDYMVPNFFQELKEIPMTLNGKIDRKSLPTLVPIHSTSEQYQAPTSEIEWKLKAIWEEVLGMSPIGIKDHFFELGGHSLMITQIINRVYRALGKQVTVKDFYKHPTIEGLAKHFRLQNYQSIPKAKVQDTYPATPSQNRIWLSHQLEGFGSAHVIAGALRVKGKLDIDALQQAFQRMVARHDALRTVFVMNELGELQQKVLAPNELDIALHFEDVSRTAKQGPQRDDVIEDLLHTHFDLTQGPLLRASLLKEKSEQQVFVLVMHHIIGDGWSIEVMYKEVMQWYARLIGDDTTPLPELSIQYGDYAMWSNGQVDSDAFHESKSYWLKNFTSIPNPIDIPGYQPRPSVKTYNGSKQVHRFGVDTLTEINRFSREQRVSLFTTLFAGVNALMGRYSGQEELVIGTPVAGRDHMEFEGQVGLYLNTLPIRTSVAMDKGFDTLLQQSKKQLVEAYSHATFPFDSLVEALALKRDSSRSPLFDVMVVLQNQRQLQAFQSIPDLEELQIERYQIERSSTQFDLSFEFTQEEDDSLVVEVNYNTDIYAGGFIETMIRNLEVFIKNALSDPTQDIGKVKMMNPAQEEQLLTAYHGPEVSFPTNKTAIDLFEDQVKANPQHMAISYSGMEYSYQRLQEEANKLANYVQAQHALQTEDLVVVMLERSDWLIISLLAVWKLGGAYVPVDPTYPEERIDYIIDDANAKLLIDSSFIDTYQNSNHEESTTPERNLLSSNLAYVIYTSGSTGNPKGVMINHSSLVNLCSWHQRTYQVDATSRGAMYSGIAFDASVWEIYPYLLAGACLFPIGDDAVRLDLKKLVAFYHSNKISHTYLPTRICRDLLDAQVELPFTTVLTGGEALRYEGTPSFKVFNNYGPTENTVVTTYFNCDNELGSNVPIGKPIDNVKAYVLSNFDLLQPIGVVGELCVSGAGISRGYLHKTTMTAACFQPSPFDSDDKIYRTGDLVRWLPTGNLEFMGRKDHQVKIRGYRIELGEIETVLQQHPGLISQAVVTVQEIKQEDHLVAYYVSDVTHQAAELRAFLQTRLPDYMVPGYYQALESIPLTSNGKVDKDQLPKVAAHRQVGNLYVAPGTPTEMKVLEIWQEHLEEPQIGMNDDFFELGGHSLLLTKLINSYQQVFEVSIDLKAVYTHTTPKAHAGLIANSDDASLGKIEVVPTSEYYQVSPSQERFWLLYKFKGASREFNIFSELRLPGTLDVNAFQKAFKRLVERHEALRTSFVEVDGIPMQKIAVASQVTIPVYDFENKDEAQDSVHSHEFDLDAAPLYRVALLDGPKGAVLYFSMHHIISDGWSMQLLGKQLMADYIAIRSGKAIVNDAPEVQYKDYAAWKKQLLSDPLMDVQRLYWKEQLAGEIPYLPLPYDHAPKHKTNTTESGYHKMYLESQSMDAIVAVLRDNRVSEFSFFLATLSILLRRLTQQEDILIGIPVANRNHYQLKDVVGCFLNTLMIRNRVQADKAFDGYLEEVNAVIMEALAHQNYPFEKLLEDLSVPKDHDRFPLSPVFLNMSEFEARVTERLDDFSTHAGTIDATPKFDLECYLKRFENGYELNCVFNAERFMPETIAYWMEAWLDIVAQALQQPARSLNSFSIFDTAMATVEDPKPSNEFEFFSAKEIEQSIVSRFEAQVAKVPENTAVSGSSGAYTYYELNAAANGVARQILEGTKQTSARVALLLDHDATCVIGMLAALKAGYSYVPIDINNPNQRIEFIVNDASCEMIVCTERTLEKAKAIQERLPDVGLVVFSAEDRAADTPNLDITIAPKKEAYVLYTSGSTGNPKGVVQIHRNVMHYIRVYTNATHICSEDRLSLFSTYTFDASVKDIFGALLNGARVCLYNVLQEGTSRLPEWLSEEKITIIHMVPTLFRFVMSELKEDTVLEHVRLIDMGGEASFRTDFELFKKHFRKGALYVNDYGPTEATIVSQKFLSHDSSNTRTAIPVGRSVTGTDVFLWDEHQNTKGIYEEGEIIFRSDFLSLGYLNRTEQTSRVFIPDPDDPSKRLYRSGDIGRMLPSGEIEFLQRKDSLVKLNGMRIELSEIEARMERLEPIMKAVVLVKKVQEQEFLTAYITTSEDVTASEIKIKLQEYLPNYMIPAHFVTLDQFPQTRTGKIDKKLLPDPELADVETEFIAASTEVEMELVRHFAKVLDREPETIGIQDNFFRLGGNSLKMNQVLNKIRESFQIDLKVELFFNSPTVEYLALHIENLQSLQNNKVVTEKSKIVI